MTALVVVIGLMFTQCFLLLKPYVKYFESFNVEKAVNYESCNCTGVVNKFCTNSTSYKSWRIDNETYIQGKYLHVIRGSFHGQFKNQRSNYQFYAVYFINCKLNPEFDSWLIGQAGKWPSNYALYIEATSKNCTNEEKLHSALQLLRSRRSESITLLDCHTDDNETHEFYGIHRAWELGQLHNQREDIIFYFHAKGITHSDSYTAYENTNIEIHNATTRVIQGTSLVSEVYDIFPNVDKVGISYSEGHSWIWYNYWYARGSYIQKCSAPIYDAPNRWYYESWLGHSHYLFGKGSSQCYSMAHVPNIGEHFNPDLWKYIPDNI